MGSPWLTQSEWIHGLQFSPEAYSWTISSNGYPFEKTVSTKTVGIIESSSATMAENNYPTGHFVPAGESPGSIGYGSELVYVYDFPPGVASMAYPGAWQLPQNTGLGGVSTCTVTQITYTYRCDWIIPELHVVSEPHQENSIYIDYIEANYEIANLACGALVEGGLGDDLIEVVGMNNGGINQ